MSSVQSEIIKEVKKLFEANNIHLPYRPTQVFLREAIADLKRLFPLEK